MLTLNRSGKYLYRVQTYCDIITGCTVTLCMNCRPAVSPFVETDRQIDQIPFQDGDLQAMLSHPVLCILRKDWDQNQPWHATHHNWFS